jgi:hypothetical protein
MANEPHCVVFLTLDGIPKGAVGPLATQTEAINFLPDEAAEIVLKGEGYVDRSERIAMAAFVVPMTVRA